MNAKTSRYHHGDLRDSIIRFALTQLESQGEQAITLRSIASELGVSRTAPYRHFQDKQALMEALAIEGFERQWQAYQEFTKQQPDALFRQFGALGRAYIHFGVSHPNLYQLMFNDAAIQSSSNEALTKVQRRSFGILTDMIAKLAPPTTTDAQVTQMGRFVWSAIHGYCCLIFASPETVTEELLQSQDTFLLQMATGLFGQLPAELFER